MAFLKVFSTLGCPDFGLEEVFKLASKHQLDGVELRALGGTVDLPDYFIQHFGSPEGLRKKTPGDAPKIFALDTSFVLATNDTASREALLRFVPWAETMGVPHLRVFDGKMDSETELEKSIAAITWWQQLRREHHWKTDLMVETHDSLFSSATIGRFVELAPGTRILWDSHHTWKQSGEEPRATWQAIKPHVVHIHVKDSISRPSEKHPFTCVMPGAGEFPATSLFTALREDNYSGPVSLEWEKLWHPYLGPLDDALTAVTKQKWW